MSYLLTDGLLTNLVIEIFSVAGRNKTHKLTNSLLYFPIIEEITT